MIVALAVPPPSQIARRPYLPCLFSNSWTKVAMSLHPVPPKGWPNAIAPPLTLILSRLPPVKVFATARGTGAKASLTSRRSMSSGRRPERRKASAVAGTGPSSMITGSAPTTAKDTILALGRRPNFWRPCSLHTRMAAAPSQICEAEAGVTIPFLNIGFNLAMLSYVVCRKPSSCTCISSGLSPFSNLTFKGTISSRNRPLFVASMPRFWLRSANLSSSSLVMLYFLARSSAPPNWLKFRESNPNSSNCFIDSPYDSRTPSPLGSPCPAFMPSTMQAPIGTCDMFSTPAAITQSCVPLITA
mmetsp:Transcript_38446/g.96508  ORF Transcript_38446/g.96508 Transcript_38446/m.96508 type:complete len:301 (+) Transcript_38446:321-1223(+)